MSVISLLSNPFTAAVAVTDKATSLRIAAVAVVALLAILLLPPCLEGVSKTCSACLTNVSSSIVVCPTMDPAASSSPPLSRTPPPCGSKRRLSSRVTNLTQYIQRFGYRDAASEDGVSSSSEGEDSLVLPGVDGIEMLIVSPMPSLRSDSEDSDGELEDADDLQLPAPLVGVPSPRLGFRVYPNPLPMTWGMLQIELICLRQELEENGELHLLQLPAPLVVYTVVESQTRGPMHAHFCT